MTDTDTTQTDIDQTTTDAAPTPEPASTPDPTPEDVFASAFAEFAAPGDKKDDDVVSPPVAAVEPEPVAEEAASAEEPPPEPEKAPAAPEPAPEQRQPTQEEVAAYYAALQAQQQQMAYQQPQQQAPLLSQEEGAALQEFRKEWPDVAKAVDIQSRVLAHQVIDYVFKEFAKEITPKLQQLDDLAERTHFEDIYSSVDDYDDVRDKVINWVQQQPDYLRNAYGYVVQNGTPDQVADLINRWRFESGQTYQQPQQAAPAARPAPVQRQPSAAVRHAAAALAPVSTKRSAVVRGDDPNDFDGAWERFANHR